METAKLLRSLFTDTDARDIRPATKRRFGVSLRPQTNRRGKGMLANIIAILALAAMFGLEAYKASGIARRVLWSLTITTVAVAVAVPVLEANWPLFYRYITDLFSQPTVWFMLAVLLWLSVRPLWAGRPRESVNPDAGIIDLGPRSSALASLIAQYRHTATYLQRELPPPQSIVMDGLSLLMLFEKQGIAAPRFGDITSPYARMVGLQEFLTVAAQLIADGHIAELKEIAPTIVDNSVRSAANTTPETFWTRPDW